MSGFRSAATILLVCGVALSGCKIIKTPTAEEAAKADGGAFNPDKMAADAWDAKVIPFFNSKAAPLAEVLTAVSGDVETAGGKYGHREKQGNAPWTFAAKLEGRIVAVEAKSRAGYADVDIDGDAKPDVRVQIGPAVKGTAIRDSLDFVNFNEFKNQIEWAQYGKAFNAYVNGALLAKLPRDTLTGKRMKAVGAFPLPPKGEIPLFTPVIVSVE